MLALAFLFCLEVIAHGHEAAPALSASWMPKSNASRLVRKAQAKISAQGQRRVSQLVQPAHLDG